MTKRKTFISYYHEDDYYRQQFKRLFDSIIVNKSVGEGDINEDNSDDYTKALIQKEFLYDTTVLVVLIGPKTRCRKHVDWEISGALDFKVGDHYAGLVGILLPNHPDYRKRNYNPNSIPKRLAANLESGYAELHNWTTNTHIMERIINDTYHRRKSHSDMRANKSIPQMQINIC